MKISKKEVGTKKLIKYYFTPYTGVIKKNERVLKIIKTITNFKSKELQYVIRVIFDEDTSNIKLSDSELTHIITRMRYLQDNFTFAQFEEKGLPLRMTVPKIYYLELKSGFKKDSKELKFLHNEYFNKRKSPKEELQKINNSKNLTNTERLVRKEKILLNSSETLTMMIMWNKILKNQFVIINPKKKSIKLSIKKDQQSVANRIFRADK